MICTVAKSQLEVLLTEDSGEVTVGSASHGRQRHNRYISISAGDCRSSKNLQSAWPWQMTTGNTEKKLVELQDKLNELELEYVRKEFELKLAQYKKCLPIFQRRDHIFKSELSQEELVQVYSRALEGFDVVDDFLPLTSQNTYDSTFIKSLKAEFLDSEKMKVTLELFDNEYVENSALEKTVYLFDKEPEGTKIVWKGEPRQCVLFNFFASDADCFDLFDIIFEFYSNMIAYCYEVEEE